MRRTIFFLLVSFIFLVACGTNDDVQNRVSTGVGSVSSGDNPLRIPELIDGRETPDIEIVMQTGAHEFYAGIPSETKGFNGDYLGPAIRLYDGVDTTITFTNNIGEPTTVHGHGLHVTGDIDGGPQSVIQPGESWQIQDTGSARGRHELVSFPFDGEIGPPCARRACRGLFDRGYQLDAA